MRTSVTKVTCSSSMMPQLPPLPVSPHVTVLTSAIENSETAEGDLHMTHGHLPISPQVTVLTSASENIGTAEGDSHMTHANLQVPAQSSNRIIIELPPQLHNMDPRMLPFVKVEDYHDLMAEINGVMHRGKPKAHVAVSYLASRWQKYGIEARCQVGYSDGLRTFSGTVLILDLPEMRTMNETQDEVNGSPRSTSSPKSNASFAIKLCTLMKQGRLSGRRCAPAVQSLDDHICGKQVGGYSGNFGTPPARINNLVFTS